MADMTSTDTNAQCETLPVGLLADGKPCLVVGGGKVALHKTQLLLNANAEVTVIAPELHADLADLAKDQVRHIAREFDPADVNGFFLVFAATSDQSANKAVLEACEQAGTLVCSADKSWSAGNFVTPATMRKGDLTVSVSTGGKSCRKSRMVKDSLQRHVELLESADLLVMGTSHNYMPIDEREPYHMVGERLEKAGRMLMQIWGVHEFVILNTCNRIELHAVASNAPGVEEVIKQIMNFDHLDRDDFYTKRGDDAFAHTCVLTAGLLSQTPGEKHIVSQVKEAVKKAQEAGWADAMIEQWHSSVLHVSKDIRGETEHILQNQEIEDLSLQYLDAQYEDGDYRRALVVGTGTVGRSLALRLAEKGHAVDWCYHRNRPELDAQESDNITLCDMNQLREKIAQADAVVCATASQSHVLHMGHAPFFDQESETLVVDLAMPRNVAPDLDDVGDCITVVDLDDLKHWYRREIVDMARIFEISQNVVENHREMYDKLLYSFQGGNKGQ